jgi:ribosomal protein S14
MTLPHHQYERVRCPSCGRPVAAEPDGEGLRLRLVRHVTRRVAGKPGASCAASECVVIRRKGGWRLDR